MVQSLILIVERGILQFRADEQTIRAVLDAAEKEKIPVGTLLKKWIKEKLEERHTDAGVTAQNADVLSRLETLESNVNRLTQMIDGARNER